MAKPKLINNGVVTEFDTVAEHDSAVAAQSPTPVIPPDTIRFSGQTVGAQTIDVSSFEIPQNIVGETMVKVKIVDTVSGAFGIGWFVVAWRRYTNGPAIVTTTALIPLQTPGALAGASVSQAVVGNAIVGRFTGVTGRTISVYADYTPNYIKF